MRDFFKIANKKFKSRLIVGTGKYKNFEECARAVKVSGAEIVTVAVRRVNIEDKRKPVLMDYIDCRCAHCQGCWVAGGELAA